MRVVFAAAIIGALAAAIDLGLHFWKPNNSGASAPATVKVNDKSIAVLPCPTGIVENFLDGLVLGALYLAGGRSLAVPIIAHGIADTVNFLLVFFHRYPGMHL